MLTATNPDNQEQRQDRKNNFDVLSEPLSRLKQGIVGKLSAARRKIHYRNFRPCCSSDAVVQGIRGHVSHLTRFLERGNMEMFHKRLAELGAKLLSDPFLGTALFVPELDELVRRASLIVTPRPNLGTNSKLLVHVATEVYPIGGHTRVIEDIVGNLPGYRHVLILTGMHEMHPNLVCLKPRFDELSLEVRMLQTLGWTEKTKELAALIASLSPRAILLFAHHYDSVAYAGVAGHSAPRVVFLHHNDHQPSLGASRADYVHVDLTPACHNVCQSHIRLRPLMLNLTVKDVGTVQLTDRHPIIGATCGSPHKYEGSNEFSYAQLLTALFSNGMARIFHIGEMPTLQKDQICADIAASGQDASRVVFLPNTPSLGRKLLELSPDFYLTSHPLGGGKATVEALSVGLPILYVCPANTPPLRCCDMAFNTSVTVSTLGKIPAAIHHLETERIALAKLSRAVYENHYSPSAFREGLWSAINLDR